MCIAASVGRGSANRAGDVKTVQVLLNLNLAKLALSAPLTVDGRIGTTTRDATVALQTRAIGM